MNLRIIISSALAICAAMSVRGQAACVAAFAAGENLEYAISYKAKMVPNSDVAVVTFTTAATRLDSRDVLKITAKGKVLPFFKWFFDLNDTYVSWLDANTLKPIKFTSDLREGSYRFSSILTYDWGSMTASSRYRNLKRVDYESRTLPLSPGSSDAVALFYNLRSTPTSSFVAGQNRTLKLVLEDTVRTIRYRFVGREVRDVAGIGRFKTLKFVCQLATSSGESFEDGTEFTMWISDDNNKIPLYMESPIRVGSIRVKLSKFSGLKYPLESKLN